MILSTKFPIQDSSKGYSNVTISYRHTPIAQMSPANEHLIKNNKNNKTMLELKKKKKSFLLSPLLENNIS
jgi:hypothetical protein